MLFQKIGIVRVIMFSCCMFFINESIAQKRVALVIGNSGYENQPLDNAGNDAKDVAEVLKELGFDVVLKLNANLITMENSIQAFGKNLKDNAIGLFYYSGHGVQYDGTNYLIPIGTTSRVSTPDHLRYKAVDVGYIMGAMKQAQNALNIVILDACRNNPFKSFSRSMNKGLKRISGAEGTIIAYSTSPGNVALDGNKGNSPYTAQLIQLMREPNMPVEMMFKEVRKKVQFSTGGKQSPWYESSISGDFYFNEKNTIQDKYVLNEEEEYLVKPSIVSQPYNYKTIEKAAENFLLVYKNKDINLDNIKIYIRNKECLSDKYFVEVSKGFGILLSYYYLSRVHFMGKPYKYFNYPMMHYSDLRLKDILFDMTPEQIIKYFGKYINNINYNDSKAIYWFVKELKKSYKIYLEHTTKNTILFLNSKRHLSPENFYDLGFPKHQNSCFTQHTYYDDILIRLSDENSWSVTYYNSTLDLYFYSFWLRRHNDGTTTLVNTLLDFILWSLKWTVD